MPKYQSLSDGELCTLLFRGDHEAFTEIYERYGAVVYVHAYRRLRDRESARDLVQELFTALWSKREQFILKTTLSSYLFTAVRNRVIDRVNHHKIECLYLESLPLYAETNTTDHFVREKELKALIEKEIDALPERMKEVFNLSRQANLSHKEISVQMDISEFTVRKQINNALKLLRPKLKRLFSFFIF